jgi:hypothetical protein
MKALMVLMLVWMTFSGFALNADTVTKKNIVVDTSKTTKRKDIIIVDGELYTHDLKDLNPNEIYKIDVLKNEKIADLGGDANSVTAIITKKGSRLYYQYKLAKYCELYRDYLKQYQNDSKIKYLLNAKAANMDALYNLNPDSINKVTFTLGNGKPVVKIITK